MHNLERYCINVYVSAGAHRLVGGFCMEYGQVRRDIDLRHMTDRNTWNKGGGVTEWEGGKEEEEGEEKGMDGGNRGRTKGGERALNGQATKVWWW